MAEEGEPEVEEAEDPTAMQRDVEITILIKAFRGDPLPEMEKTRNKAGDGEGGEGEEGGDGGEGGEGEEGEEPPPPPPTLEEMDVRFNLTLFNGESLQSEQLTFIKPPPEEGEEGEGGAAAGGEGGEEGGEEGQEERPPVLLDEWTHEFKTTVTIDEDSACAIAKSVENSMALNKAELDAPMLLLPIDLAPFIAGDKKMQIHTSLASTEMVQNPYNVTHFTIDIVCQKGFLTPSLTEKLNPLCVTIIAAEDLPNHRKYELMGTWKDGANPRTMSITELREECKPAYCKYSFMPPQPPPPKRRKIGGQGEEEEDAGGEEEVEETEWNRDIITPSMPQDKNIRFKHKKVYMAGLMHPDDLIQHLKTNPLQVELHDRDRIPPPSSADVGEEEGGGEGEESAAPIWSGLKSIDKTRAEEQLPQDPFAICSVNLMPLCDGRTFICERSNLWPRKIEYPDFSAHQRPTKGDYVDCGSCLIVKVEVSRPLQNAVLYPGGPFQRVVYRFKYSNAELLERLSNFIIKANSRALGTAKSEGEPAINSAIESMLKDGASLDMIDKALNTVELAPEHLQDETLDIITGVQVIDSNYRIFILEGLAQGNILNLLDEVPRLSANSKEFKVLYNPEITFTERLYPTYNVDIKRIRLRETLRQLILKVDTYLEPKYMLTAWALMRLNEISNAGRMKKLRDLLLFPTVPQLEHMYKKLGDALSIEDLTGKKPVDKRAKKAANEDEMPALTTEELAAATAMPRPKHKAPTDHTNPVYLQFLSTKPPPNDFQTTNIQAVASLVPKEKDPTLDLEFGEVYNYSGQFLQYGGIQAEFQRKRYDQDYGKIHWTYSKDLISGAFVLRDPEVVAKEEKKASKARWLTKEGFQWPKAKQPIEFQTYEQGISDYRKSELQNEFVENEWNGTQEKKIVLPEGQPDFKTKYATQPQLFEKDPDALKSVFAAESGAALEAQERKSKTYNTWKEKVVVDNKSFHVLWTGGSGLKAKQMPLLKDKPRTRVLKTMPHKGGLQPDHPYPGSMYSKDSYVDPIETYIVDTYGTFLRFEDKSLDDRTRVTRWNESKAIGIKKQSEKMASNSADFRPFGNKRKEDLLHKEKLHSRKITPLVESDKPTLLYRKPDAQPG